MKVKEDAHKRPLLFQLTNPQQHPQFTCRRQIQTYVPDQRPASYGFCIEMKHGYGLWGSSMVSKSRAKLKAKLGTQKARPLGGPLSFASQTRNPIPTTLTARSTIRSSSSTATAPCRRSSRHADRCGSSVSHSSASELARSSRYVDVSRYRSTPYAPGKIVPPISRFHASTWNRTTNSSSPSRRTTYQSRTAPNS